MFSNSLARIPISQTGEYSCSTDLNLYVLPDCQELSTQGKKGRQLKIISSTSVNNAIEVCFCEDNYSAWLKLDDLQYLQASNKAYQGNLVDRETIVDLIPQVVQFTYKAMETPNYYLWGGTVAPNYDCSGLMQAAFASVGVWLPRNSYQQEAFTQRVSREDLMVGDLIFFGGTRVNHVALYLGDNQYIHSSGTEKGNNGIAINQLADNVDRVSSNYYRELWSFGRIMKSFV
jgi:hypothetical protein